jgi:hypothetical protein
MYSLLKILRVRSDRKESESHYHILCTRKVNIATIEVMKVRPLRGRVSVAKMP